MINVKVNKFSYPKNADIRITGTGHFHKNDSKCGKNKCVFIKKTIKTHLYLSGAEGLTMT